MTHGFAGCVCAALTMLQMLQHACILGGGEVLKAEAGERNQELSCAIQGDNRSGMADHQVLIAKSYLH